MKNKSDIQAEINSLIKQYKPSKDKEDQPKRVLNAVRRKIAMLNKCVQYLDTNPREEFLNEQLNKCYKKLEIISRDFRIWFASNPKGQAVGKVKAMKMFEKEMDKNGVVLQIKTLKYILS